MGLQWKNSLQNCDILVARVKGIMINYKIRTQRTLCKKIIYAMME